MDTLDDCLSGGGEMGALMRAFDWSPTPLGPVHAWPQSLKTSVGICLSSEFPIILWWGPELTVLYNDKCIPILGAMHPHRSLGKPGQQCWAEIWDILGPMLNRVIACAEATSADDVQLFTTRDGYPEECYFRFSSSPIWLESGCISGVFTPVIETTEKVIADRRLRTLRDLAEQARMPKEECGALIASLEVLGRNRSDVPFASLYLFRPDLSSADLIACTGIERGQSASPENVSAGPLFEAASGAAAVPIDRPGEVFPGAPPASAALVLPLTIPGDSRPAGFLLAGVSAHKRLDSGYQSFFELVAGHFGPVLSQAPSVRERAVSKDITERERLEQQLLLLVEASGTLLSASDSGTIVETIIELGRRFVAADAYALWRTGPTARNEWRVVSAAGLSDTYSRRMLPGSNQVPLPAHAVAAEDVYAEPLLAGRREEYRSEGIRSMLTVPLRIHGGMNGTLVFYYRDRRSFEPSEITVATALGNLAAAALANADLYDEQRTLRQEAEKAHERSLFLAKTGALLATSLDIDRTLAAIADLAVPSIADWCAVDLLEPGEHFRRVSVKHSDPEKVAIARAFHERYPPEPGSSVWRAMHGETVFASEIIEEKLRATVHDEEHLALLLQLGLKSFVIAPLIVHGEQLGMLTLVAAESGRRYDSGDIQFVEEVAQRAAFAVHSARLHQALRESVARLRAAAAAAEVGIFEWQMDADEALWENPRMYEIFGRTLEDGPLGRHEFFSLVAHPDDADTMMRGLLAAMEPGGVFKTGGRIFRKNGEVRWVELSGRFEFTPKGKPHRLIGAVSDVTERRRMEDRLRETAKLESIGILAGGIAHDFNNLLTGILGNASLSSELLDSDHPVQDFLNDVVKASERAAALTGQMLAYSGRGTFVVSEIDLAALVREIAPLIRTSVARTVDLDLHLGSKLSPISADGAQMQQIVMNLIINGAEAMGDKPGKVTVSTHECTLDADYVRVLSAPMEVTPGRYVCLEVEDHGCGMDQATIARIFDPFFTTKFTGRGLGLSAVLGIVRAHHGALNVYSDPGVGTTFKVFFPVRIATPQPVPAERPHRESGPTVLVIDDEDIVLRTAQIMLDRAGYRVVTAKNGDEALQIFRRLHDEIALVFLDLTMPVMGGEETLSRLKEIRPGVRVVLSTGFTDGATLKRLDDRLVGHLEKPYSAGRLRELLRELLP